jgi:hypothetical protein
MMANCVKRVEKKYASIVFSYLSIVILTLSEKNGTFVGDSNITIYVNESRPFWNK